MTDRKAPAQSSRVSPLTGSGEWDKKLDLLPCRFPIHPKIDIQWRDFNVLVGSIFWVLGHLKHGKNRPWISFTQLQYFPKEFLHI